MLFHRQLLCRRDAHPLFYLRPGVQIVAGQDQRQVLPSAAAFKRQLYAGLSTQLCLALSVTHTWRADTAFGRARTLTYRVNCDLLQQGAKGPTRSLGKDRASSTAQSAIPCATLTFPATSEIQPLRFSHGFWDYCRLSFFVRSLYRAWPEPQMRPPVAGRMSPHAFVQPSD